MWLVIKNIYLAKEKQNMAVYTSVTLDTFM